MGWVWHFKPQRRFEPMFLLVGSFCPKIRFWPNLMVSFWPKMIVTYFCNAFRPFLCISSCRVFTLLLIAMSQFCKKGFFFKRCNKLCCAKRCGFCPSGHNIAKRLLTENSSVKNNYFPKYALIFWSILGFSGLLKCQFYSVSSSF